MRRNGQPGPSLSDYALILGLGVVLVLPVLMGFGGAVSQGFGGMFGGMESVKAGAAVTGSGGASTPNATPSAPGKIIELSDESKVTLPAYIENPSDAIETLGANGSTTQYANTLEALARQLMAAGKITSEQANGLIALANQGHRIAKIEGLVEQVALKR